MRREIFILFLFGSWCHAVFSRAAKGLAITDADADWYVTSKQYPPHADTVATWFRFWPAGRIASPTFALRMVTERGCVPRRKGPFSILVAMVS